MRKITVELAQDTYEELLSLADSLGFSPEMAAVYAIRLVNACVREGLLEDVPARAWPREARVDLLPSTGTSGKVIAFPAPGAADKQD
ncbi:MAG: hypothetical protein Q4F18_13270 [Clostridia bacterium]|nr:hypothetical protein [Clostridia bacterium]